MSCIIFAFRFFSADAEDQRMYERKKQLKETGAAIRE